MAGRGRGPAAATDRPPHRPEAPFTGRWRGAAVSLLDVARTMADHPASGPPPVCAAIGEILRAAVNMKVDDALDHVTRSRFQTVARL